MNKLKLIVFGLIFLLLISTIQISAVKLSRNILVKNHTQYSDSCLLFSTFIGGDDIDGLYYTGVNIIRDNQGNVFIAGTTESNDFPTTSNAFSNELAGDSDIFITKINNDFTDVLASTYIGGSNRDEARDIDIDENGNIFICGATESSDFPVTMNAFQSEYQGGTEMPYGSGDAFIVKLNNNLELVSSTFLGGFGHDFCNSICVNTMGNIIVTGSTSSSNFPISEDAYDKTHDSGGHFRDDVFITILNNDLSNLIASTFVGGSNDDYSESISIDSSNNIFIGGWTSSSNFPTTLDVYDNLFGGGYYDCFISKFNDDLTNLISSTYIGGNQWDFCYTLNLDIDDNVYISGHTASFNYPTTSNAYCKDYQGRGGPNVGDDAFISKFSNDLSLLIASTYLGGDYWENGFSLIISDNGLIYVAGTTTSSDFPTLNSFCDIYKGGIKPNGDIFISCFNNDLSNISASTFLGGSSDDGPGELIFDINGEIIVSGSTSSSDFPIIGNCYDSTFNGDFDVFLSKFKKGITDNVPPNKPDRPSGEINGKTGEEYNYTTSTIDPDGDDVFYLFDWGDGITSFIQGPYESGEECIGAGIWFEEGNYEIKVKSIDEHDAESEWSEPLTVSMPKQKKSSINNDWYYYPKLQNYAPMGMPDFDQRQESWRNSMGMQSFCGPTAVSNVLWYIDSKFSDPMGYPGDGIDNYSLVQDYNAPSIPEPGPLSDDHNFNNVNDPATPWDSVNDTYGNEFIEKIAWYVDNDGVRTGGDHLGSTSIGICEGITQWIQDVGLSNSFDIIIHDTIHEKSLDHIINHIECGDFIILNLGFYTTMGIFRGSHWVTVAGISESLNKIVLCDPYNDFTNFTTDYIAHNDAGIVSHDIFSINNTSPLLTKSSWWIEDYKPDYSPNSNALIKDAIVIAQIIDNEPPEKPLIEGPESGKIENEYQYIGLSNDINNDTLYYLWDWGDGNNSDWLGPYDSGENSNTSHIWFKRGYYEIRVKAKDIHGEESEWSDPIIVSIPKNRNRYQNSFGLFDLLLTFLMKLGHFPSLSTSIVKDDNVIWSNGYGFYDLENKKQVTKNTLYNIASISKTITSTALMQLWEQGLFDLDDDVNNFLPFSLRNPNFPDIPITFRMLLSHQSSLAEDPYEFYQYSYTFGGDSPVPLYPFLETYLVPNGSNYTSKVWSNNLPGETFHYSNIGFTLIGFLVEQISGIPFDQYCMKNIFIPLNMFNTSYRLSDINIENLAVPYDFSNGDYVKYEHYGYIDYPAGSVRTSISELSHFLIAHMNSGIYNDIHLLNEETVDLMHSVQFLDSSYGLGWGVINSSNGEIYIGHQGGDIGVITSMYFGESDNVAVIIFVNVSPWTMNANIFYLLQNILFIKANSILR